MGIRTVRAVFSERLSTALWLLTRVRPATTMFGSLVDPPDFDHEDDLADDALVQWVCDFPQSSLREIGLPIHPIAATARRSADQLNDWLADQRRAAETDSLTMHDRAHLLLRNGLLQRRRNVEIGLLPVSGDTVWRTGETSWLFPTALWRDDVAFSAWARRRFAQPSTPVSYLVGRTYRAA